MLPPRNGSSLPNADASLAPSRPNYSTAEPLQGVTVAVLTRAGNQDASPDHLTLSGPFSGLGTATDARPRPTGFVAIPSATTRGNSVDEILTANASESRELVQMMTHGWKEDAKSVLIFIGIFTTIVSSFIIESYKLLSPGFGDQNSLQPSLPPTASIIAVNMIWLISLVLNIISALFATLALQWTRRYTHLPQVRRAPRDHEHGHSCLFLVTLTYDMDRAVATTVMLLHLSVFLFLVGLAIFFFTIHRVVAIVVSVAVGLFGAVYLMLTILACIDRSCPYRTPLSDVWCSRRERLGHT